MLKETKTRFLGRKMWSLKFALVAYVVIPLTASLVITGYAALKLWERQVETRMKNDLEIVARAIQLPLSHAMERNRKGGVEQALESALSIDGVYSAYAYDLEGKEIAAAGMQEFSPDRAKLTKLASTEKHTGEYGQIGRRRVYSRFVPLYDSRDQSSGLLQLTRRERDFRNHIGKVRIHAALFLGSGTGIMIVLVLFGTHKALGRHFQQIITGMQRVGAGESDYRIPVSGPDEVASIAETFNKMLDNIHESEKKLRQDRQKRLFLEQQLRQNEKLAAIGRLAAGVAHELGAPLSTISGTVQQNFRDIPPAPKIAKAFERIRRETGRMEVIIRQLLDFSYTRELHPRNLLPARIARSAVAAVSDDVTRNNAVISISDGSRTPEFSADPVRLEQALVNLLKNAVQAGTHITARLGWRIEKKEIIFTVDDNGPGIPEEIRPHLFEPFFTTKDVGEGTGLGLAIVYSITREHGGSVRVKESDLGGTRIELRLPMSPVKQDKQA